MIRAFKTTEELFQHMADIETQAKDIFLGSSEMQDLMQKLVPGAFFVAPRNEYGLVIFGEVVRSLDEEDWASEDKDRLSGWLAAKCYSDACVHGEHGRIHISRVTEAIDSVSFEKWKARGWV